jgi:SAM-dependent methyltransferase
METGVTDDPLRRAISGAEAYEALHVPALFQEWTRHVLDAARVGPGHRVVDVACGTGILARAAAERVGRSGRVAGVDPDLGMLTVAGRLSAGIEWWPGNAEDLPFEDASFDRVVSQFGMMFFSDRGRAIREMTRVLAAEGRFALAVWNRLEESPAYSVEVALLQSIAGQRAANALRAPFALGDRASVRKLVEEAAGTSVEAMTVTGRARFPSIRAMVEADLRGWLPVMGVYLDEHSIGQVLSAAEEELSGFVRSDGQIEFDSSAHLLSGTKAD